MSTPTPGPWIADGYDVRQTHGRMIAYCGPHHTPADEYPLSCRLQDEANAQWVAAAPAALAAAKAEAAHYMSVAQKATDDLTQLLAENDEMRVQIEAHKGGGCQCADDEACAHMSRDDREANLLSALKLMVSKFDAFIDSEYCGTDLLAEQLAQADFAREVIREAEGAPFGT